MAGTRRSGRYARPLSAIPCSHWVALASSWLSNRHPSQRLAHRWQRLLPQRCCTSCRASLDPTKWVSSSPIRDGTRPLLHHGTLAQRSPGARRATACRARGAHYQRPAVAIPSVTSLPTTVDLSAARTSPSTDSRAGVALNARPVRHGGSIKAPTLSNDSVTGSVSSSTRYMRGLRRSLRPMATQLSDVPAFPRKARKT